MAGAGFWRITHGKDRATLMIEPRGKVSRADKAALTAEGRALLAFAAAAGKHDVTFAKA